MLPIVARVGVECGVAESEPVCVGVQTGRRAGHPGEERRGQADRRSVDRQRRGRGRVVGECQPGGVGLEDLAHRQVDVARLEGERLRVQVVAAAEIVDYRGERGLAGEKLRSPAPRAIVPVGDDPTMSPTPENVRLGLVTVRMLPSVNGPALIDPFSSANPLS